MASSRACFVWGAIGALAVLLAAAAIVPQYAVYKARAANASIFDESAPLRQAIEARILGLGTLENAGLGIEAPSEGNYSAAVSRDGLLVLRGLRYGHVLVLTPHLERGAVSWQCIGGPPKAMPRPCRGAE
jgi:hypothetical protein